MLDQNNKRKKKEKIIKIVIIQSSSVNKQFTFPNFCLSKYNF